MWKKFVVLLAAMGIWIPMMQVQAATAGRIGLEGIWRFQVDTDDQGYHEDTLVRTIHLPGTTDEAGVGGPGPETPDRVGTLARRHEYLGAVWYARQITIPAVWVDLEIELTLERVMWQSRVLLDGESVGNPQDSLCTPHVHKLGKVKPGKHTLAIQVDNRMIHPIGNKNHAYGEQTQSRWNGIVGTIELAARPSARIEAVRVFAEPGDGKVGLEVTSAGELNGHEIRGVIIDPADGERIGQSAPVKASSVVNIDVACNGKVTAWSEFSPKLYETRVELIEGGRVIDVYSSTFGFRKISRDGNKLFINGVPAFMRGNLDCVHFPKTGYPSPYKKDWIAIFKKYREHNLNHVRFHSWCPPEAAFEAADELGIYIQAEGPIWIDRWMTSPNSRPEMDTEGYPKGLGLGDRTIDSFARAEFRYILDAYGNHPSFVFFCLGNELGPSDFGVLGEWVGELKQYDRRRLYGASTARAITENCEFIATHHIGGIGMMRQHMQFGMDWDYEGNYGRAPIPTIAHEVGQWPVYPEWSSCEKFDGVLRNTRLETMREEAKANGVYGDQAEFTRASGALNGRLYKDEIESFLRTPSCRGFQLLSMQDFLGQGEAYIGWLDCFWDSKGTTDPAAFRGYCGPVVALAKLPTYIFVSGEKLLCDLLVRNDGPTVLEHVKLTASLTDEAGKVIAGSSFSVDAKRGEVIKVGQFAAQLTVDAARRLNLVLAIDGKEENNSYPLWVYPKSPSETDAGQILVVDEFNEAVIKALEGGAAVLLIANKLGDSDAGKNAVWKPLYWSVPFFPGQHETLGLVVRNDHPAFEYFPTEYFNDWQWYRMCSGARGFDLTGIVHSGYKPIAQPVTDFHINNKLGSIFEVKVGRGKLLVSGYDLAKDLPEVRQLKYSLIKYMQSDAFSPSQRLGPDVLKRLFKYAPPVPVATPEGFEDAIFYVKAAAKKPGGGNAPWKQEFDDVLVARGVSYEVKADGIWRDNVGTSWHGKRMQIDMKVPDGITGDLYIHLHDWNRLNRHGKIWFEGREFAIGKHDGEGKWLKLHVMREEVNDGKLVIKTTCHNGPNLMITAIALIPKK